MEDFEEVRHLGRGAFGEVKLMRQTSTGLLCAVKKLGKAALTAGEEAEHLAEVKALQTLQHPCILRYYGSVELDETLSLVMEFADAGDLQQLLKEQADSGKLFEVGVRWWKRGLFSRTPRRVATPWDMESCEIQVSVSGLDGYSFTVTVSEQLLGRELWDIIHVRVSCCSSLAFKTSVKKVDLQIQRLQVRHESQRLSLSRSLKEQGLSKALTGTGLSYVYVAIDLRHAWRFIQNLPVEDVELSLEGITAVDGIEHMGQVLQMQLLPNRLQHLSFGEAEDQLDLRQLDIPTLKSLQLGSRFNQSLEQVIWPQNLQVLALGDSFNQSLKEIQFPESLEVLTFGRDFNQPLGITLSTRTPRLRTLMLGRDFDQSLQGSFLPNSLERLTFGARFDQSLISRVSGMLRGVLPKGLLHLTLGLRFNQSLEHVSWPCQLQTLSFGDLFNQRLPASSLPPTLQRLRFGAHFNEPLRCLSSSEGVLRGLQCLGLGVHYQQVEGMQWCNLEELQLGNLHLETLSHWNLPQLQRLTLSGRFNQPLAALTRQPSFDSLLSQLRSLTLGHRFDQSLEQLHMLVNLEYLSLGDAFNQGLEEVIWPALQSLHLGARFNQSLERVSLPKSLQRLSFGDLFDQPIRSVAWPEALQMLSFGEEFNQPLQAVWPAGLRGLSFGDLFNQSLEEVDWPPALRSLSFGARFNQSLVNMPNGLESLTLGEDFTQGLEGLKVCKLMTLKCHGLRVSQDSPPQAA
ncbi:Putative F-box and FNIP repeat-containing protein L60 [Durusdinium trenchii]|uniref:F-box and FNIP repeat-containing protein L60 n=1 Tax=Durusdinium trenchii TaxID=1381693 RepID=A0ABP0JF99_9DINO